MFDENEAYKKKIIELVGKIDNFDILNYIYIIIFDIIQDERVKHDGK